MERKIGGETFKQTNKEKKREKIHKGGETFKQKKKKEREKEVSGSGKPEGSK